MTDSRPIILATSVALAFLVIAPSAAQPQSDRNCREQLGSERRIEARQRRTFEAYEVRSLKSHCDAGDQVRRVFYVDGYGRDLLLIAFVRAPGHDPTVWVHFPRREREVAADPLRARVPWAVWQDVLFRSALFNRDLVPLPPGPESSTICLHGWIYVVEATDPPRSRGESASMRRAVGDACEPNLMQPYAIEIERMALPLFPHCARLATNHYRNPSTQLAACRILRGDSMAAAEVRNLAEVLRTISGPADAARLAGVLTDNSLIDWNGERNEGQGSAAAFWATHAAPIRGVTSLYFESIEGESANRVRLTGTLTRTTDTGRGGATGMETARVEQIWTGEGGFFRIERANVGPWEPYPPPIQVNDQCGS